VGIAICVCILVYIELIIVSGSMCERVKICSISIYESVSMLVYLYVSRGICDV
jgi:hypothetical protein